MKKNVFRFMIPFLIILLCTASYCPSFLVYAQESSQFHVEEYHATAQIASSNNLNVRSGPSTDYKVLTTLPNGAEITIIGKTNNNWYEIQLNQGTGFVAAKYVSDPIEIVQTSEVAEEDSFLEHALLSKFDSDSLIKSSYTNFLIVAIILISILMIITLSQIIMLTRKISKIRTSYNRHIEYDDDYEA